MLQAHNLSNTGVRLHGLLVVLIIFYHLSLLVIICYVCLISVLEGIVLWVNRFPHGVIPLQLLNDVL
jgi:hypothetical protein